MDRPLTHHILQDLEEKMVLLAGPRQVGKTTLARSLPLSLDYLNWDIDEDRIRILDKKFLPAPLWIFDEIHKFAKWRNYLKGIYDKHGPQQKILVTGSARLDTFRRGGDSLQGRYHFLRLLPLSFQELKMTSQSDLETLFSLNGFPEPFFKGSKTAANRWSRAYRHLLVKHEVASVEQFQDLGTLEILYERLIELGGKSLSINSLAEDIQISHKTAQTWVSALEKLYGLFLIAPFGPPKIKALKKATKLYFFDWNGVQEAGPRFENFMAVHLIKWVNFIIDTEGRNLDLRYYRDKYNREVDFVILENHRPLWLIDVKLNNQPGATGLRYLKAMYPQARALQVALKSQQAYVDGNGIEHLPARDFLRELV